MNETQTVSDDKNSAPIIEEGDSYATDDDLPEVFNRENEVMTLFREGTVRSLTLYYDREERRWYKLHYGNNASPRDDNYNVKKTGDIFEINVKADELEEVLYGDNYVADEIPDDHKEPLIEQFVEWAEESMWMFLHNDQSGVVEYRPVSGGWWIDYDGFGADLQVNGEDYADLINELFGVASFTASFELLNADDLLEQARELSVAGLLTLKQAETYVFREAGFSRSKTEQMLGRSRNTLDNQYADAKKKIESARSTIDILE